MIWLTWRQHRIGMLVLLLVFGALAFFIIQSGLDIHTAYYQVSQGMSAMTCRQQQSQSAVCQAILSYFHNTYEDGALALPLLLPLQALVGMFLGAPLVASELERGTYRLIWTQSVTQRRWLLVKVGAQMGMALLVFAVISLLIMWWNAPGNFIGTGMGMLPFDFVGIVPLAYMAFALALAIAAGMLLRKTGPAMVVTLVGDLAARFAIETWVRPYYMPPFFATWDPYVTTPKVLPDGQDWTFFAGNVDHAGHLISDNQVGQVCSLPPPMASQTQPGSQSPITICTHAHGWLHTVIWQPIDRFWLFQGIESAIFFGLAAALLALAFWWVRTRIS